MLFCVSWALVFSVPWDLWAIRTNIWMFPGTTNVGLWFGLPLEEYFFIMFVTLLLSSITIVLKVRFGRFLAADEVK